MIRSNTPHPYLYRQRDTRPPGTRQDRDRSRLFGRAATGIPKAARDRRKMVTYTHTGATWTEFLDMYETFTDVLCVAAKSGVTDRLEREYVALRWWFLQQYPHHASHVRKLIGGTIAISQETHPTVTDMTTGEKRRMDSFESLFLPKSLHDVLASDRGDLISRVSLVSVALYQSISKVKQ